MCLSRDANLSVGWAISRTVGQLHPYLLPGNTPQLISILGWLLTPSYLWPPLCCPQLASGPLMASGAQKLTWTLLPLSARALTLTPYSQGLDSRCASRPFFKLTGSFTLTGSGVVCMSVCGSAALQGLTPKRLRCLLWVCLALLSSNVTITHWMVEAGV